MRFVAMVAKGERAAWTVEAKNLAEAEAMVNKRLSELPRPYRDASMLCVELRAVEEQLGAPRCGIDVRYLCVEDVHVVERTAPCERAVSHNGKCGHWRGEGSADG